MSVILSKDLYKDMIESNKVYILRANIAIKKLFQKNRKKVLDSDTKIL